MAVECTFDVLDILSYLFTYYTAYHGWAQRKIFKIKALRLLQNAVLKLNFANTVFHKKAILLILVAELKERVRHSLIARVYYRALRGWARRKIFKLKVFR